MRPILEYADVVWHSSITFKQSRDIESIQRRACRIILANSYESYVDALGTCQFDSLFERRENHCHIGLLKGCLIMSGLNLFSLLPDLNVMAAPYVTVPIFHKFL